MIRAVNPVFFQGIKKSRILFVTLFWLYGIVAPTIHAGEKSFQTCADIFRKIGENAALDEKLTEANIPGKQVGEGTIYLGKTHIALRQRGSGLIILKRDEVGVEAAFTKFVQTAEAHDLPIIITGDISRERQIKEMRKRIPETAQKRTYLSPHPDSAVAKTKLALLQKKYNKVQIILDLDISPDRLSEISKSILAGDTNVSFETKNVEIVTLKSLAREGKSLSDILFELPLPIGTFRLTFAHHSNGILHLTDKSSLSLKRYTEKRIQDNAMEIAAGCKLGSDANGWLIIDRNILAGEILKAAKKVDAVFEEGSASGEKIFEEFAGKASDGDLRASLIKLLDVAPSLAVMLLLEEGIPEEEDEDATKRKTQPRVPQQVFSNPYFCLMNETVFTERVAGKGQWFKTIDNYQFIKNQIGDVVRGKAVMFLDSKSETISFFVPPAAGVDIFPEPLAEISLASKLSQEDREAISKVSGLFWFLKSSSTLDPHEIRSRLLNWQESNGIKLPFIMIPEPLEPERQSWVMLKPFFHKITVWGQGIPNDQGQAKKVGLFWCTMGTHKTEASIKAYHDLIGDQSSKPAVVLNGTSKGTQSFLADLLVSPAANACLIGSWSWDQLRLPSGPVWHKDWANNKNCAARISFISIRPVRTPLPDTFHELEDENTIPKSIAELITLAKQDETFATAKPALENIYGNIHGMGGEITISTCGQYLIISE